MYKKYLFLVFILFLYNLSYAQEIVSVPKFGKIDISELHMKECSFEKGASAMNLLNYEEVEFVVNPNGDYKIVTETVCRIKIFDNNGFKKASIIIPYSGRNRTSKITEIEGSTYNIDDNGKVIETPIGRKEIFRNKADEKEGLSTVRFTFPDLKAGSVIEYRYKRVEKNSYYVAPWFFQSDVPVLLSACKIIKPAFTGLNKRKVCMLPVEEGEHLNKAYSAQFRTTEESYAMRNIPSFKMEPFMSSVKDNLQRIEFSLIPRAGILEIFNTTDVKWKLFNSLFLIAPFFGQQFNKDISGTQEFTDSLNRLNNVTNKINAVYQYVKKNISWDRNYTFYADDIATVWKEKQGNSAEINIIILNLLRKAGIDCYPVIFSTRENGKIDISFPNLSQFNSVDVLVFDKEDYYILDGSETHLSFKIPPLNILNREALIIDKENSKWITITDNRALIKDSISVVANLDKDGLLKGEAVITYYDLSKAAKIEDEKKEEKEAEGNFLLNDAPDLKIDTSYEEDKDNELKPLREIIKFHYDLPATNEFYFLNPFLLSTFRKNPFTDSSRRTDMDFGANSSFLLHMEITLPDEIKVEELTKNKIIRTPDTILLFNRFNELNGNILTVNSRFDINEAIFEKEAYPAITSFFKNVYGILSQQILLKRKE